MKMPEEEIISFPSVKTTELDGVLDQTESGFYLPPMKGKVEK